MRSEGSPLGTAPTKSLLKQPSTSMSVKLKSKPLLRSADKEKDYYPESPGFVRRKPTNAVEQLETQNEQNFPCTNDWVGSTIELSPDVGSGSETFSTNGRSLHRVIEKNGKENVVFRKIPEKSWRYMRDLVNTLMELKWKYMLTLFLGSYFLSWLLFAALCYVVAFYHGDLTFDPLTGGRTGRGEEPCIYGVENWVAMILYSVETQTTLGGGKYASEECPETIFLYVTQMLSSALIEGCMITVVYAKTARPARQITKLKFSDKAVVCYRDGQLCLLFRVCDPREQQSIGSKIRVYIIVDKGTREGEIVKTHVELKLEGNGEQIILWPDVVCHVIDETSPLAQFTTAKLFNAAQFELYVSIVGTSPATAQLTEAKTSYLPSEIFWGQRFINIIHYDEESERYIVDYKNFNTTISVDMPMVLPTKDQLKSVAK
ncbi:ATP-sensitive inward rectifier potassium channel 11-like [Drosophila subpulchrella]|uniref:ATP-sensitive inward rectifier potassium channel 11-like n=1 Tax=Drosophila subpulchrella TaxID=1486046 RepID=UPI0018A12C03|nr:ATP-sensitive inward rectifier potassium channel 11-like [Drosophila subpulchrella]